MFEDSHSIFTLFLVGTAFGVRGQDVQPSANQTIAFLSNKVAIPIIANSTLLFEDGVSVPVRITLTQKLTSNGGCDVLSSHHVYQEGLEGGQWREVTKNAYRIDGSASAANAKDFSLSSVTIQVWMPAKGFSPQIYSVKMPTSSPDQYVLLYAADETMANRLKQALIGLGKACGAKAELY